MKEYKDLEFESWEEVMKMPEVFTMRKLKHPNIVTLKDVILERKKLYLVYDLMDTTIQKMLNFKSTDFTVESRIKLIMYDVIKGVSALHEHGFIHGNLSPSHLFVREDSSKVLIGDLAQGVERYSINK